MKPAIFAIIASYYIIESCESGCEKRPFRWTTVWPMEENYVTYKLVGPITNNKNSSLSGTASFNNAVAESLTHYEQMSTLGSGLLDNEFIETNSFLAKPVAKHTSRKVYRDPELNECVVRKMEKKDGTCQLKGPVSSVKRANHPKAAIHRSIKDSSEFNQMEESAYDDDAKLIEKPTYISSPKTKNTRFKNYQHPIPHSAAYNEIPRGRASPFISKRFYGVNENAGFSRFKGMNSEYRNDPGLVKDNVISQCKMQKTKKNFQAKRVSGISDRRDYLKKGRIYPRQNVQNPKISKPKAQRRWLSSYTRGNRSIKPNISVNQSDLQNGQLTKVEDKGVMEEDKSPAHSWFRDLTPWFKSS